MSSHHVVREKQEPALLVLGLDNFDDELLGQLLEWSPTVVATPQTVEKLLSYGIKIDWLITNGTAEIEQSDVKLMHAADSNLAYAALQHLSGYGYPAVNIIINNAGVQYTYTWLHEKEGYQKIANELSVNLVSPLYLMYGLLPMLSSHEEAAIVNVTSGLLYASKKSAPVYCGTKAALHATTKALRYQLEDTPVKVFEIIPPLVSTPMTAGRGQGKIMPAQLVDEFMENFRNDVFESNIGKVKILKLVQRLFPAMADRIMKNG